MKSSTPVSVEQASTRLVREALKYVGVKESSMNAGAQVELFQRAVDGKAEKEAWCAAFVMYCIDAVQKLTTESKLFVFRSEHVLTIWNNTPKEKRLAKPEPGCLIVWRHQGTTSGHIGIVESVSPKEGFVFTIEGNTSSDDAVTREGDGVYRKLRSVKGSGKMQVLGYLRVFEADQYVPSESIKNQSVS